MQETSILREITNNQNLPQTQRNSQKHKNIPKNTQEEDYPPPTLEQMLQVSTRSIDFGLCLPGSVHEKPFSISILQSPKHKMEANLFIVCDDEALSDLPELVFGINQYGQSEYYDDYKIDVTKKCRFDFKIGVKTPMYYSYQVQCYMGIKLGDYPPIVVSLTQNAQIPEIVCPRQLVMMDSRVLKISVIQGKSKKQCRVPFKLNHAITIPMVSQIIGLESQKHPLIDVKPKSMTLAGKGQFSLIVSMGVNEEIRNAMIQNRPISFRRVLTLKIKDTKFIYHFPLEVTYYPEKKNNNSVTLQ